MLACLVEGPSEERDRIGLRSALVPELAQIVEINGDLVTIDLNEEFSSLRAHRTTARAGADHVLRWRSCQSIDEVRFLVAGQAASVPRGDGSSTDRPVSPDDYSRARADLTQLSDGSARSGKRHAFFRYTTVTRPFQHGRVDWLSPTTSRCPAGMAGSTKRPDDHMRLSV